MLVMKRRWRASPKLAGALLVALGIAAGGPGVARAQPTVATIHPIFGAIPDLPQSDEVHRRFAAAVARHRLGPVEVLDVPGPAAPRARELLRSGKVAVEKQRFEEAEKALGPAADEVNQSGAAGLSTEELADLFIYLGMALQKADWKDPPAPVTQISPPRAREAYLQAAVLARERLLLPRQFPPLAIASWQLAVAEIAKRPRGTIVVKAPGSALIALDGGPLKPGLLPAGDLVYGNHFVRVDDPGRRPWAEVVRLDQPMVEVQAPATGPPLSLEDRTVARAARRQGAAYALLAEPRPGRPATVELRLIEVASNNRRDTTVVPVSDLGALEAAVMRLDQVARQARITDPAGPRELPPAMRDLPVSIVPASPTAADDPRFAEDPRGWAHRRWPLLTAVGVAVGSAVMLGILAASSEGR
jgi:hypothetical protein